MEFNIIIEKQGIAKDPHPLGEFKPDKAKYMFKDKITEKVILNKEVFDADTKKWEDIDVTLKRYEITEDLFKSGMIFTNISILYFTIWDKRKAVIIEKPNKIRILSTEWK